MQTLFFSKTISKPRSCEQNIFESSIKYSGTQAFRYTGENQKHRNIYFLSYLLTCLLESDINQNREDRNAIAGW